MYMRFAVCVSYRYWICLKLLKLVGNEGMVFSVLQNWIKEMDYYGNIAYVDQK